MEYHLSHGNARSSPHPHAQQDAVQHLNSAQIKTIYAARTEMLRSLSGDVSTAMIDTLDRKIKHERDTLCTMVESDTKRVDRKKKLDSVLPSEYFTQRSLDIYLL